MKTRLILLLCSTLVHQTLWAAESGGLDVSFETADQGLVHALLYKNGDSAVVLAHGAVFNKESWKPFRSALSDSGLTVLALDFRGYGKSLAGTRPDALYEDILAAVRYLKRNGAGRVSVLGASMGGGAAAQAAVHSVAGEIDKLVLLSPVPIGHPERMHANSLFIASRGEGLVSGIQAQFDRAPEPKRLVLLDGSAHAQHIFKTEQAAELTRVIVDFLTGKVDQQPG